MHNLNEEQIFDISNRLKADEISFSHLFDDLLDHVCCDVETYMQQGKSYGEAKNIVYNEIGLNGLREIQEATVLYVKFNLLRMKKLMKVMSLVGTPLLLAGLLFKIMHWPGASILFLLGSILLFLGYFPIALLIVRKEKKLNFFSKDFLIYIVGLIVIVETGLAMLFTSLHWPGATVHTIVSVSTMMLVFFPMLVFRILKSERNRIVNLSITLFAFLFSGFFFLVGYIQSTSIYNVIDNVSITEELNYYKTLLHPIEISSETDNELVNAREDVEHYITQYKTVVLGEHESIYQKVLHIKTQQQIDCFYDNSFTSLKAAIQTFQTEALLLADGNEQLSKYIEMKLSTDPTRIDGYGEIGWNKRMFNGPAGENHIYISLNKLLLTIYQVEYELLRAIPYSTDTKVSAIE